ncbi:MULTISPECIES: 4-hydroxy-3-methylbut-2-enyl diphosphate reductase [Brevibacillus]|jgi:4-hydroxy-3-methylbut-2-enyl diphosphate reductase|uniref:4-hydroxy-3-methylbut-2-enyl diphosphate reductase n=1 Tax=Brevibacillus centrosporus TaxID=54910 RepID=A0A1I3ZXR9_9BACL|nr:MULTISPECIES: 4-hydroxy-3-methylbut-2-enyl diphosphate reductase [Brevibacillus]MEC2131789.1 4-hydroxy-3-methylbut-2-enyl diphosphate reductase [Brevibacillus centrosporus]MED1953009.1 4-hydroxy-3-methylbut-2-enyl diphosphate reductase [Brevibacillus centrosporus]MED4908501.1 4-hydroxy-3-methylbut-2-enyl diphosphate reductase [Brevibacillus centrosporus]RNB67432.1 4-hydroxy-3-methylbut-2-enyl diphosphate reductase [Brevibacillus centrosporus]SFK48436.1 4-hydroxy-3-methylbut-2-enyl diphospha
MEVIKISPRGYCYGVVDAMVLALRTAQNFDLPRPIHILGMIVHNAHVVEAFEKQGIKTLDGEDRLALLDQVNEGTIIFTAHGVSPEVRKKARDKGLTVVDATCPDVTKTHDLIREKVADGYHVLYIGKKGHPEPEGAIGIAPEKVHLVQKLEDLDALEVPTDKVIVTNQTTMSQWDVKHLMDAIVKRFPRVEVHNEICLATQVRQEAVAEQVGEAQLCIVVGDPRSNNSNRLAQVSEEIASVPSYRIADLSELDVEWLKGKQRVAVTSGASTPTPLTKEVIAYLEQFDESNPETWEKKRTVNMAKILPAVK